MADTSQGKTLDDVYGIISKLAESQAMIAQSQASLAQSHASLAEGQAALSRDMSELVNVQKEALEAQKETAHSATESAHSVKESTHSVKEMLDLQKKTDAANAPQPPTMDAGSRLTRTFELLEHILLHDCVVMETVLFAQRVNKCFNATINSSKLLQQKLFFAPVEACPQDPSAFVDGVSNSITMNPLLTRSSVLERIPLLFDPSTQHLRYIQIEDDKRVRLLPDAPVVHDENNWPDYTGDEPHLYWQVKYTASHLNCQEIDLRIFTAGSWRRMYFSQPPLPLLCEV
ncbi:hypothetical protein LTR10_009597 [Elasticomyces elasticus]|nr:hypothetical protein LTR10_009597 [Elasticomyces elasticus]KAK4971308.1 hypothetical protein LTR42_007034 [Elasticomyces elasticus]